MKFSELRQKEVINTGDGARLGFVTDAVIDEVNGRIKALLVPKKGKTLALFGKETEYEIAWDDIKRIGEDIILTEGCRETE